MKIAALALLLGLSGCGAITVPLLSAGLGFGASAFKLDLAVFQWWETARADPVPMPATLPPDPPTEKATP